jgi:5'-nucleotidase
VSGGVPRRGAGVVLAALLLAALALAGVASPAPDAAPPSPWAGITVLHTNDLHGNVLPRTPGLAGVVAKGDVGGFAALASFLARERKAAAERGDAVLLLDGGDVWSGTPEGNLTRGDLLVEAMGRLRYDAVAFGNHELDLGAENAARLAKAAPFPWIAANVTDAATGRCPEWLKPWVVLDVAGLRVGVVGMSPQDTPKMVSRGDSLPLRFGDPVEAAKSAAAALDGKADVLLFLTHLGPDVDRKILAAVPRCRLVVGGHTHTRIAEPVLGGPGDRSWVVQAGTACVVAGRVRLRVHRETKEVALDRYDLLPLAVESVGSDAETAEFLKTRLAGNPALAALDKVLGRLSKGLSRLPAAPGETTPAGNLVADAMRAAVPGADVALVNRGGLRVTLPAGPVTGRDVYLLMPFDDTIVEISLTGAALREVLAASLSGKRVTPLEASGIRGRFRATGTGADARVEFAGLEAAGAPLDPARRYRVVTNQFLAQGRDGYEGLRSPEAKDTGVRLRDAIGAWFSRSPSTDPDETVRLRPE